MRFGYGRGWILVERGCVSTLDIKGKGTLELSSGVLHLRWKPGVYIGIDVARAALEAIATLTQGARLPMLVEIQGVTHSAAARKLFPAPSDISRMALLGSSPVDRVIAMFRLSLISAGFPIRYFTSADQAMAWLLTPSEEAGTELRHR
jgi:hypothetical protein